MQHCDNEVKRAFIIYKSVQESLPAVARYIQLKGGTQEIKGIIGITFLHKGANRLGFESHSIHSRCYKLFKQATLMPIYLLSSVSFRKEIPTPMYLFMSKDKLFDRYKGI